MARRYENVPQELKSQKAWVCYKIEQFPGEKKPRKVPYNPLNQKKASSTAPDTWTTFERAIASKERFLFHGIGYVFSHNGYVGIDVDGCRNKETGELTDIGKACMELLPTYCEVSPSGCGLHFIAKGVLPPKGRKNSKTGVEMYEEARFFTVTGQAVTESSVPVAECQAGIDELHKRFIQTERQPRKRQGNTQKTSLTDVQVLDRASAASNGEDFKALYEGRWQGKYESQSEADMALCMKLAFWTGKDKQQMDRLFKASALHREKWDTRHYANGSTYGEEVLEKACDTTEEVYQPRDSRGQIIEVGNAYHKVKPDGGVVAITNFIIKPLEIIQDDDEGQFVCRVINEQGEEFNRTFMTVEMSNLQSFKRILNQNTISLSYTGTEGDLELLKAYLSKQDCIRKRGVRSIGVYKHLEKWIYVDKEGAMDSDGGNVEELIASGRRCEIKSDILRAETTSKEDLQNIGKALIGYNEPAKTVTVLCFISACFVKEKLRLSGIKFPHLIMTGEAGSGKSNTLEKVVYPIFSASSITGAGKLTNFSILKTASSSNTIPFLIDEFKPSTMDRMRMDNLMNFLRDSYDGHDGQRGRPDMSVVLYKLLAPVVMAGEESPMETAVKERSMELLFSKKDIAKEQRQRYFETLVSNEDILHKIGKTLLLEALKIEPRELVAKHKSTSQKLDKKLPARVRGNMAVMVCGVLLLEKMTMRYGLTLEETFGINEEGMLSHIEFAVREYLLDGNTHNKSVVDKSFEIFDRMNLVQEIHYTFIQDYTRIGFDFKTVYDLFTKYMRDHAIAGECLPYSQFTKQIRQKDYFLGYTAVRFGGDLKKGYVFDLERLRGSCDIENLASKAEMLGFSRKKKNTTQREVG